ncbi:MAG: LysR family transcriptional regulator [Methylococcaceae bacterium NSP1-1]|jgi:DNA-binding transcriptional LysR family regulator|nr:LysR family transcriptional regulator [Methylococcaceae bacterium]MDD1629975.1 LysR family transcriptional regulator [Methylococcaceae bacterium]OYV21835.1 MAG: LysR family transcriptional regulator [Methylococcaceae bacterium NSP1-1]
MDKLNNIQVFCRIVELGTFAAVAREMHLSAMMISKYMAQLENSLGVALLNRTTRQISLTEAGEIYYYRSKQLIDDFSELDETTAQLGRHVKGTLKISAPIDFGGLYMVPAIDAYQRKYPDVKILMTLHNSHVDLSKGSFDLSILVTDSLDLGVVARKIAKTRLCTYASPGYLAEYGKPDHIDQLSSHRCLHYIDTPHKDYWLFNIGKEEIKIKPNWHFASNNGRALCQAAALGLGITQAPEISAANYVAQGKLIEILQDFRISSLAIYAIYLQRRFLPAKLTTFVDFMVKYFAENEA